MVFSRLSSDDWDEAEVAQGSLRGGRCVVATTLPAVSGEEVASVERDDDDDEDEDEDDDDVESILSPRLWIRADGCLSRGGWWDMLLNFVMEALSLVKRNLSSTLFGGGSQWPIKSLGGES